MRADTVQNDTVQNGEEGCSTTVLMEKIAVAVLVLRVDVITVWYLLYSYCKTLLYYSSASLTVV